MKRILVAFYQHETNTFAPSLADWTAFNRGGAFPAYCRGQTMLDRVAGSNIGLMGFCKVAEQQGWQIVPSVLAGTSPSSYVTEEAFENISNDLLADIQAEMSGAGLAGIYLDLHGAAVAQHQDDSEGELLLRIRRLVKNMPIIASLDLHANVSQTMLQTADGLVSYRTYPHIDMAKTGELAGELLIRYFQGQTREPGYAKRVPFLININAQSTWLEPAKSIYQKLVSLDQEYGTMSSFCMAFPASDIADCAPVIWSYSRDVSLAKKVVDELYAMVTHNPNLWNIDIPEARDAISQALHLCQDVNKPIIIADTQDNPGAGGDSNTTGMIHTLLSLRAGQLWSHQIAVGMLYDPLTALQATHAGVGAKLKVRLGKSVATYGGMSEDPVEAEVKVKAVSDGWCTIEGEMMHGLKVQFGPSACLELEGILVAVVSSKAQLLDRSMLKMLGIRAEDMKIIVVKSSNHFRADFTPIASRILVAKALGPMAADPQDLPWTKLRSVSWELVMK
ncbi:MAG: M81 family metallopeptidase [Gammaproteobacteria bacterium]|nr:M81 family metallopeptidase [Gammaproteobacteria bacterium]